jgi:hypothetical protein
MFGRSATACGVALVIVLQAAAPVRATESRLPDGTRIAVRLMEQISSATYKSNDPVNFAIIEDVVVNGEVVIKQGTPVRGVIVEAEAKRRMGRAGKMMYTVNETKAVDRSPIRLRAVQDRRGDSHVTSTAVTTTAVAVFVPVAAPFFLLRKGTDVVVPEGTRVDVFVDGDHLIAAEAEKLPLPPAPVRASVMTNADILLLHRAGLGQEVLLAKIAAATPAFTVEATDLVALKKAGVPERVIAAMLSAR